MESTQQFTVEAEEEFLKCGDAIVSRDRTMFALRCCYCKAIFMELTKFVTHINYMHEQDLELEVIKKERIYEATEHVFKEEYPMAESICDADPDTVFDENMETFANECEWIDSVMAEGDPDNDNDELHTLDDGNSLPGMEEVESSMLEEYQDNTEETDFLEEQQELDGYQCACENIRHFSDYQSETSLKFEEPGFICEPNSPQELNADSYESARNEDEEEKEEYMIPTDDTTTNDHNSESNNLNAKIMLNYANRSRLIKDQFKTSLEEKCNKHPELWDSHHPQYSNKPLRIKTMKYITKLMQMEYPRKHITLRHIQVQLHKKRNKIVKEFCDKWNIKKEDASRHSTKRNNNEENDDAEEENVEESSPKTKSSSSLTENKPSKIRKSVLRPIKPNQLSDIDLAIIKLYEKETCLWDVDHPQFTDMKIRMATFRIIMNELNLMFFADIRRKLKVEELRLRITKLCDWYKAQLCFKYRCKIMGKPFKIDTGNEMHFKQFQFLQKKFEPTIEKEEELKIRDEVEAQYLQQKDAYPTDDDVDSKAIDSAQFNGSFGDEISNNNNDVEVLEGNVHEDDFSKQERLETIRFIEVYKKFPILWNPKFPDSHSFKEKRKAIDAMAKMLTDKYLLPMNAAIVRQKIKNIRNQYKFHFRKIENGVPSNLWLVPYLDKFLKEHIKTSLRRIRTEDAVKKMPISLDLPFRFDANLPLNVRLIEILRDSPALWQSDDLTFQVSTELLKNESFHNMIQQLNVEFEMQLDENNMLTLLNDLCEWFKREKLRQQICHGQEEDDPTSDPQTTLFTPSSVECWEKMQFLIDYKILPQNFVCATCHKYSKSITSYLFDRARHASNGPFKCFYCDKRFMDITNCRTHECRIHSKIFNYNCDYCGRKFAHGTDALVHRRRFHTQERLHVCEICGKSFISAYEMKRHRKFHLREPDFTCNMCDESFIMRTQLLHHKQTEHAMEYNKICKPCGRLFPTLSELKKHKQLECEAGCPKVTRRRRTKKQQSWNENDDDDDYNDDEDEKSSLRSVQDIIDYDDYV